MPPRAPATDFHDGVLSRVSCSLHQLAQALQSLEAVAIAIFDSEGQVLSWNSGAQKLFGYGPDEICGGSLGRLICADESADQRVTDDDRLRRILIEGRVRGDKWWLRKNGSRMRARASLHRLGEGESERCFFLAMISPSAPEVLPGVGHPHPEQLIAGVGDYAIFALDPAGRVASWNDGARNIKGYESHEIIGKHFSCFYPADAIERGWPDYELRAATTEGRIEDEGWRLRKDGSSFWANVVITAIRDERGKLLGFCKITRDLTGQRKRDEELRQSEQRLRALMEALTDHAIFMLDRDGFIASWSSGCERLLGYRAEEIIWKHVSNLYRKEDIAADLPWSDLAAAAEHGRYDVEGWRQGKQPAPFRARVIIRAVYADEDAPSGYAHIVSPLQAGADAMSPGSATQIHAHLLPIRNALELLRRKGLSDPVAPAMLETVQREVEALALTLPSSTQGGS